MSKHLKLALYKSILLSMVFSLLGVPIALAASGDLDTTFSTDGRVTTDVNAVNPGRNDRPRGLALQTDGKIVAAGFSNAPSTAIYDFALTRYTTDGSLDPAFSGDGRLLTNFGGIDQAFAVAIQANGKIVAAGP